MPIAAAGRGRKKTQRRRGPVCSVCRHPQRQEIDRALVQGVPDTQVSANFRELSDDSVRRHRESHLPAALSKANGAAEVARADDLLGRLHGLQARTDAILEAAEQAGDLRTALGAIRESRGNLELLARLLGELEPPTVNVILSAQWVELRTLMLRALEPYPAARVAVAGALEAHARH